MKPVAPSYGYGAVSLSNVMATTCQYEALKYVTFPLQTLGKCAKMIPVMVWGSIMLQKRWGPILHMPKQPMNGTCMHAGFMLMLLDGVVPYTHAEGTHSSVQGGSFA